MIESVILLVYTGLLGIEDIKRESISVWQAAAGVMIGIVLNLTLDKDLLQGFISGSAGLIVGMLVMLLTRGGAGAGDISMFFIVSMIMGIVKKRLGIYICLCDFAYDQCLPIFHEKSENIRIYTIHSCGNRNGDHSRKYMEDMNI